jgi:nicotinamidase-related amidase
VFAAGSESQRLHPEIERRADKASKRVSKTSSSVFADTDLLEWLRAEQIDTITLSGYMTNNCVLASAAAAEPLGLSVEVLSDATGAIPLSNDAGAASAAQIHETLMALLNSNWAVVATTASWIDALQAGAALPGSNLIESAMAGRSPAGPGSEASRLAVAGERPARI